METFWSTAWRYAKGESGLPSVLPVKGSGEKSRRVRLFCKGLKQFREILYPTEKTPPTSPGHASPRSTLVDPSSRRVSPSNAMVWAEATSTAVADVADPSLDGNELSDPVSSLGNGKMTEPELLRQLEEKTAEEERVSREAEKHAARSKQLRAEIAALKGQLRNMEVQDGVAKTHANALTLSNFVSGHAVQEQVHEPVYELGREPDGDLAQEVECVEETTYKQDQVHELGRESDGDLAHGTECVEETTYKQDQVHELGRELDGGLAHETECVGEATYKQDQVHERGREQQGGLAQGTECLGETTGEHGKEGSVQNHSGSTKQFGASAYGTLQHLECSSGESGQGLDDEHDQEFVQDENKSTIHETVEMQDAASTAVEFSDWQNQSDPQADATRFKDLDSASREVQPIVSAEKSQGIPKEEVEPATLTIEESIGEKDSDGVSCIPGALGEGKACGVGDFMDETGEAIMQDDEQQNLNTNRGSWTSKTEEINNSEANSEDIPNTYKHEGYHKTSTSTTMNPARVNPARVDPPGIVRMQEVTGTCIRDEGAINSDFEFSEAPGAATLWGILQSSQCEDMTEERADDAEEAASSTDARGPTTLWGILRSDQSENEDEEQKEAGEDTANSSETSGKAVRALELYKIFFKWRAGRALQATEDAGLNEKEEPTNTPKNERDQDGPNNGPEAS